MLRVDVSDLGNPTRLWGGSVFGREAREVPGGPPTQAAGAQHGAKSEPRKGPTPARGKPGANMGSSRLDARTAGGTPRLAVGC